MPSFVTETPVKFVVAAVNFPVSVICTPCEIVVVVSAKPTSPSIIVVPAPVTAVARFPFVRFNSPALAIPFVLLTISLSAADVNIP